MPKCAQLGIGQHPLPLDASYVFVKPEKEKEVEEGVRWVPRRAHRVFGLTDYRHRSIILLKID